jgi:hypothetical protein
VCARSISSLYSHRTSQSLTDRAATELAPLNLAEVKCAADAELLAAFHPLFEKVEKCVKEINKKFFG